MYKKDELVVILDYPFGKPTNVRGKIVGFFPNDFYNVLIETGCNEGQIIKYKYWKIMSLTLLSE